MPPSLPRVAMLLLLATIAGCGNEPLPSSEWHRMNGGKLQSKGDYAGAIAEYDRAIARSPNNAYAYNDRGVAKRKAGDTAGAVADFDHGVQLDPNYGSLYFNRAYTKAPNVAAGSTPADLAGIDVPAVLADYEKAIRLTPYNLDAYQGRILIHLAWGHADLAIFDINRRLKAAPHSADAGIWRGVRLLLQHRDAEAQAEFEKVFRAFPACRAATTADVEKIKRRRDMN